ncbi:MAG: BACON domain-containing protein [Cystobacterineae bacterium]|nr:BACON domain-containing protein [Cystobacterineae bacterium]
MKEKNLSRKCFALGFLCLAFAFAACGDDGNDGNAVDDSDIDNSGNDTNDTGQLPLSLELNVGVPSLAFGSGASEKSFNVTSNTKWEATCEHVGNWCSVTPSSGSDEQTVWVSVTENNSTASRYATVVITNSDGSLRRTVTLTQSSSASELEVSQSNLDFNSAAGYKTLLVFSNTHWEASCTSSGGWCSVAEPAFGNSDGMVRVNVTANTSTNRTATVSITDGILTQTVKVMQSSPSPGLEVSRSNLDFSSAAGYEILHVFSNTQWNASCTNTGNWCTLGAPPSGNGDGTLRVNVAANNSTTGRTATVSITNGTLTRTVRVTQPAALTVMPTTLSFGSAASSAMVYVSSDRNWSATVACGGTAQYLIWCGVTPSSGSGDQFLTVNVLSNTSSSSRPGRTGTLTITAGGLSRTVNLIQAPHIYVSSGG